MMLFAAVHLDCAIGNSRHFQALKSMSGFGRTRLARNRH